MHVWFGFPIQYDFSVGHGDCLFRRTRMMPNPSTSTPRSGRAPFEKFVTPRGCGAARGLASETPGAGVPRAAAEEEGRAGAAAPPRPSLRRVLDRQVWRTAAAAARTGASVEQLGARRRAVSTLRGNGVHTPDQDLESYKSVLIEVLTSRRWGKRERIGELVLL